MDEQNTRFIENCWAKPLIWLFLGMDFSFNNWSYQQKALLSEILYLFLIVVVVPFFVGIQLWDELSHTFGLIVVNVFQLPAIVLFYRYYLPRTILAKRYLVFFLLFIPYLLFYEINARLSALAAIHLPMIADGYQDLLRMGHPERFDDGYLFNQTFGYTFLLLLTASALAIIKELFRQQQKVYEMAYEKIRLELNHLKSQVQPHFFFNTLNNLYTLSLQQSPMAPTMIANLSEIMRYVIYESEHEHVSLDKEINFMTKYIELEKIRHSHPSAIEFEVQGDASLHHIEPLLFLPLIENCFKHGFKAEAKNHKVRIVMAIDDDELTFQTSNRTQPSTHRAPRATAGGIGLKNVKKRLELLYPSRHSLIIEQIDSSFEVILTLNFKKK